MFFNKPSFYRYDVYYHPEEFPKIDEDDGSVYHSCKSKEEAFDIAHQLLEDKQYADYTTLYISKVSLLSGRSVGSYTYSKLNNNYTWKAYSILSYYKIWWMIYKIAWAVMFHKFKMWVNKPLYIVTALLIAVYMLIVSPGETLTKLTTNIDAFGEELAESMETLQTTIFIISIIVYSSIIYSLINFIL